MKKFTLIAGMALVALGASAQFNVEGAGYLEDVAKANPNAKYVAIAMNDYCVEQLGTANVVPAWPEGDGTDPTVRELYFWDNTFTGGTASTPAPGWNEDNMSFDYTVLEVIQNTTWSGAGYCIPDGAAAVNFNLKPETRFRMSYSSIGATAPASVQVQLLPDVHGDANKGVWNFSLGAAFEGAPVVGKASNEDWQTIDISLADLAKLNNKTPNYEATNGVKGNYMVVLGGAVAGSTIAIDNAYFYTAGDTAIEGVEADNADAPVEYFNLQGVKVANPEGGLFIKVQGNKATKVVL